MQRAFSTSTIISALFTAVSFMLFSSNVAAQGSALRIAAVVNEDVISLYDLEARIRLSIVSSKLPDTRATRQRLTRQVLNTLIDESLKTQASEDKKIKVRDREIQGQVQLIEQRNKMPSGQLFEVMRRQGIDPDTLVSQIRSQIAWGKLVARTLRRRVNIGEEEIDEQLEALSSQSNQIQKRVFEIFVPLEDPGDEAEVRQNMARLLDQLKKGANFSVVARNFSQAQSASLGGDRGWVLVDDLPDALQSVVQNMGKDEISQPIETLTGYYILKVADERRLTGNKGDIRFNLKQITLPIPADASTDQKNALLAQLNEIRNKIEGCSENYPGVDLPSGARSGDIKDIRVGDMNALIQTSIQDLQKGETSAPISLPNAAAIFTICERIEAASNLPSRKEIRDQLTLNRLELLARQYLRDLRQSAFIDIRL